MYPSMETDGAKRFHTDREPAIDEEACKELCAEILRRAYLDLKNTCNYGKINVRRLAGCDSQTEAIMIGEEVRDWFWEENYLFFFSFRLCCEMLEMNQDAILEKLERYRVPNNRHLASNISPEKAIEVIKQVLSEHPEGMIHEKFLKKLREHNLHTRATKEALKRMQDDGVLTKARIWTRPMLGEEKRQVVRWKLV